MVISLQVFPIALHRVSRGASVRGAENSVSKRNNFENRIENARKYVVDRKNNAEFLDSTELGSSNVSPQWELQSPSAGRTKKGKYLSRTRYEINTF